MMALAMAAVLALGAFGLAGCSGGGAVEPVTTPVPISAPVEDMGDDVGDGLVVVDMIGREVRLSGLAERVVALMPADVETLYAIGAGDVLVGRGEYCNYPLEALEVQSVQSGFETNTEQIIALEPDLLLMTKLAQDEGQIQQFEAAGIEVFVTDAQDIEGVYMAIGLIGQLVGKEAEAEAVVGDMRGVLTDLGARSAAAVEAAGGEPGTIYFEVSPLEFGLWTAGAGTFMNEVAELLHLRNIFSDVYDWAEISEEQVIERDPDYILTVGMYFGDGPTPIESILSRQGWENIAAIRNEAILNLTEDELSRPGPRLALGAQMLYEFVYGG